MYVYFVENMTNGSGYVGLTSQSLARRWRNHLYHARHGSQSPLHRAIRKYGEPSFELSVIGKFDSRADMVAAEIEWIAALRTFGQDGYNVTRGGDGALGRRRSPEEIERSASKIRGRKRGKFSDEWRRRLSESHAGYVPTDSARRAMSIAQASRYESQESRDAASIRLRELWTDELRAEAAVRARARWSDADFRSETSAKISRAWTPERRSRQADAMRALRAKQKQEPTP